MHSAQKVHDATLDDENWSLHHLCQMGDVLCQHLIHIVQKFLFHWVTSPSVTVVSFGPHITCNDQRRVCMFARCMRTWWVTSRRRCRRCLAKTHARRSWSTTLVTSLLRYRENIRSRRETFQTLHACRTSYSIRYYDDIIVIINCIIIIMLQ